MTDELTGRALDAAVAEEVMGLNVVHRAWPQGYPPDSCQPEAMRFCTTEEAEALHAEPRGPWYTEAGPVHATSDDDWPPQEWEHGWGDDTHHCMVEAVPPYSTDIAAAWQVVEKLTATAGLHDFELYKGWLPDTQPDNQRVSAVFTWASWSHGDDYEYKTAADTAPEAICRAALKAVRAK